jgi:uncharacterized protein YndB with AHSA1/START domain
MTRIECNVMIEAPVERVFDYAADYRKWSEWFAGVSDFTSTSTVTRGNGARFAYKARVMGLSVPVETEIHDFVENKGWNGVATKGLGHRTYWTFEPAGNSTRFTYAMEYELPLPVVGSLLDSWFIRPQWRRILQTSLENLKQHFTLSEETHQDHH